MVAKPIKLCKIALYSLNYFCSMTNKKKGANQLSFTANCLLGKTTAAGIKELEQRGFWIRGGILPYMGYIGMCRCEGYVFQAVYSGIVYINQSVWV